MMFNDDMNQISYQNLIDGYDKVNQLPDERDEGNESRVVGSTSINKRS